MKGIQFVVDDHGKKKAVLIDLQTNKDLWEDIYDSLVAAQRVKEPRETLEEVKQKLQGKKD